MLHVGLSRYHSGTLRPSRTDLRGIHNTLCSETYIWVILRVQSTVAGNTPSYRFNLRFKPNFLHWSLSQMRITFPFASFCLQSPYSKSVNRGWDTLTIDSQIRKRFLAAAEHHVTMLISLEYRIFVSVISEGQEIFGQSSGRDWSRRANDQGDTVANDRYSLPGYI